MFPIKKKFFLLACLFLLQSCEGGKIGNFLETSFEIEKEESLNKINNLQSQSESGNEKILKKNKKQKKNTRFSTKNKKEKGKEEITIKSDNLDNQKIKNKKKLINPNKNEVVYKNQKNYKSNKSRKNKKEESYRLLIIINKVNPEAPLEEFSNILRNSDIQFEIEKIEKYKEKNNKNNSKSN